MDASEEDRLEDDELIAQVSCVFPDVCSNDVSNPLV